jgi:hypothetical protein
VLVSVLYEDSGDCDAFADEATCTEELSFYSTYTNPLCHWSVPEPSTYQSVFVSDATEEICSHAPPVNDFGTHFMLIVIISLLEVVWDKVTRGLSKHAVILVRNNYRWFFQLDPQSAPIYPTTHQGQKPRLQLNDTTGGSSGAVDSKTDDVWALKIQRTFEIPDDFNHHDTGELLCVCLYVHFRSVAQASTLQV